MINMAPLPPEVFTREDTNLYEKLSKNNVLTLFIYNKNLYFNNKSRLIDLSNPKVRTEMRRDTAVAPLSVFGLLDNVTLNGSKISYNEITLDLNKTVFSVKPFDYLGHLYVPLKETAEALGLSTAIAYNGRVTVIGNEAEIKAITEAFKENENLPIAAADLVIGKYDAYKFKPEDFKATRDKWRRSILGTKETIDTSDEGIKTKLKAIENEAEKLISTLNRGENIPILWGDKAPEKSEDLHTAYINIRALALAFGTFGSKYYKDDNLKNDILFALKWMYENMYGLAELEDRGWRSINAFNWWHWYCGAPDALTDILLIMEEHLTKEQISNYMMLFKWLLDNWRLNYTQNECSGRMAVGTKAAIILEDPERLTISANDYHIMLDIVLEGPGTHTDYCNYQHGLPYNLSYGFANLHRVLRVGANLAGTPLEFTSHRYYNQFMLLKYMFDAAMYRGRGFKSFKGRGYADDCRTTGYEAASYITAMFGNYGPEEDEYIRNFIKYSLPTDEQKASVADYCSIAAYPAIINILKDPTIPSEDTRNYAHAWFSADRAAQHRNGYAFSLAMPSYRHPSYECINHCNKTAWYTGDGALAIYNKVNDDEFFGENFIFNPRIAYRIPGTTVDSREREAVSISEGWYPSNDIVGCMDFDKEFITAGMDYSGYNMEVAEEKPDMGHGGGNPKFINDLKAKKAYFMLDKECVCLGAGISSTMDSEVSTVLQNRILIKRKLNPLAEDIISVDGNVLENTPFEKTFVNPKYAYTESYAGFVFLGETKLSVSKYLFAYDYEEELRKRTGPEQAIPYAEKKERPFVEMLISHGKNPVNAGYAYAILPDAEEEAVKAYAEKPEFEIISNTPAVQAIKKDSLGIKAFIFYEKGKCDIISVNTPLLVTLKEKDGVFKINAAEPTNKVASAEIIIDKKLKLISCDNRFTLVENGENVKLILNTSFSQGEGFEACFNVL
ncbi:MAG: hypothetical protein J6M16_00695 [Clostridia bacterium]|nr:hypothetical protein [Clostridia bacterium]